MVHEAPSRFSGIATKLAAATLASTAALGNIIGVPTPEKPPLPIGTVALDNTEFHYSPLDPHLYPPPEAKPQYLGNGAVATAVGNFAITGFVITPERSVDDYLNKHPNKVIVAESIAEDRVIDTSYLGEKNLNESGKTRFNTWAAQHERISGVDYNIGSDSKTVPSATPSLKTAFPVDTTLRLSTVTVSPSDIAVTERQAYPVQPAEIPVCAASSEAMTTEAKLSQQDQKTLCNSLANFEPYLHHAEALHVFMDHTAHDVDLADEFRLSTGRLRLSTPFPRNVGGYPTASTIVTHEATHAVHQELSDDNQQKLATAYRHVLEQTHYQLPPQTEFIDATYDLAKKEQIWATITESTYINELLCAEASLSGHPFDKSNEMFASTAAILHTFPDKFIQHYRRLLPGQQAAISHVVRATLNAFNAQNNDGAALQRLFPKIEQVKEALAIKN